MLQTPIGFLELRVSNAGILSITFTEENKPQEKDVIFKTDCLDRLQKYFQGERDALESMPLELQGTDFQRRVLQEVQNIPYGKTATYAEIAEKIGNPKAVRAVGTAIGGNPLAIMIPCHRVIPKIKHMRADSHSNQGAGCLPVFGQYRWGFWRKEWLLQHESS